MVDPAQLWLPIVVSAVVVFFVSSLVWMVLPHHKKDIRTIPEEPAWLEHITRSNLPPGTYMWPGCGDGEDMNSEAFKARYNTGPWGTVNILAGKPNFALNLVLVLGFYVVVSVFVAYLTGLVREPGAGFSKVFQVAGTAAFMGYCLGGIPGAIFMGKPLRFVLTDFMDGLAYALLTGVVFAWLWPDAGAALTS